MAEDGQSTVQYVDKAASITLTDPRRNSKVCRWGSTRRRWRLPVASPSCWQKFLLPAVSIRTFEYGFSFWPCPRGALISQRGYEVKRTTAGTAWVWAPLMCGAGQNHALTATVAQWLVFSWKQVLFFWVSQLRWTPQYYFEKNFPETETLPAVNLLQKCGTSDDRLTAQGAVAAPGVAATAGQRAQVRPL